VTLRRVGIRPTTLRPPLTFNRGSFRSSDSQLDEIWALGAYTLLDQLPPGSVRPLWTVTPQGLDVPYSPVALYYGGGSSADYTATFEAQVVANEAAWVVHDNALIGYAVTLDADNDALGAPNALRVAQTGLFGSTPGFPSAGTGSFGFQNAQGADARFRNLSVISSAGQTLYASALTARSVLDVFGAGTVEVIGRSLQGIGVLALSKNVLEHDRIPSAMTAAARRDFNDLGLFEMRQQQNLLRARDAFR
jgi:hypothetical protein